MQIVDAKALTKEYKALKREGFFNEGYASVKALVNFDITIQEPAIFGLVGPNGAGKTTFIKLCLGLIKPTQGEINVLGFDPYDKNYSFLRQVGFVSGQKQSLEEFLPAFDSLMLNGLMYDLTPDQIKIKVNELSERFKVSHKLKHLIRNLSLGERMKFELIASIMHSPKILFLDEPTLGLDFESRNALYEVIQKIHQQDRTTIFMTSHHLHDITSLCHKIAIINSGTKLFEGTIQEILNAENHDTYIRAVVSEMEKYSK